MRSIQTVVSLMLLVGYAMAAEVQTIDDFEYADAAAADAAWEASQGAPPAELMPHESAGGKTAMKLPCPFTQGDIPRSCYDRKGPLNLLRAGAIAFDFYVDDPAPISYCSIYFHTGNGWFAASFGFTRGWQHVVLGKGAFRIEEKPGGWDQVDTVRISAWKGQTQDTFCAFDNLEARTEDLAVVRGLAPDGENETARRCAEQLGGYLDKLGLPYGILTDKDVEGGALAGQKLAIFGYSPSLTPEAVAKVQEFVAGGGKVMVFYSIPDPLRALLGISSLTYMPKERDGQFAQVALDAKDLTGLPASMRQDSWNVNTVQPGGQNARVIGTWQDAAGQVIGPGVLLSDNGVYMGHILTDADAENKQAFLLSVIGHFLPAAWQTAAEVSVSRAQAVGPYRTQAELSAFLQPQTTGTPQAARVKASLAEAAQAEAKAERLLTAKEYPEVLTAARQLHESLMAAYLVAHTPRTAEFRAVWNHSGTGDCGTWDDAMRRLKDAGFNAVVPNMWWGGVAHYDSKLLPHSATFDQKGDQIAQCVAAGKKYGIEVHPWKVNWNLSTAPASFVAQMRTEKRLQANYKGEEEAWLCPSHPANYQLELDTMLEVVRNYDVDGVHFDYIRYPHGDVCYCDGCRERFEAAHGAKVANWPLDCYSGPLKDEYRDWRCGNITRLVKATSEAAHKLKPYLKISAAVFSDYPGCRTSVGQDWVSWCREGYLDFVCPMNYTDNDTRLENLVANQVSRVGSRVPLYSGIGAFIIPDDQAVGQLEIARANGADGFILFNMGTTLAEQGFPRFVQGITSAPAILPHNGPEVRFVTMYDAEEKPIRVTEAALKVTVELASTGRHRKEIAAVTGKLELQDTTGKALAQLGPLPKVGEKTDVTVTKQPGTVRVAAVGTMTCKDGTALPFVVRSRPYNFAAGG
ncbi:MAG: hypothetical protein COZ06_26110 [Armatimonadetes bacterium CG_4_10_14_3_um_filter_66_18]|nr:family 10 glycosylhydrolase [Armatimonadota bacterium]OIO93490.1 MAG: hypothetical protein AUJ96_30190 [Armatimonadetes bacterium CG2_30_66_41]PIU90190.1 MAG: hypothetical protein COS65_25820 [Armatimonadetes bacterium CG06_land_8_20_14_3_00_66_21]PIX37167.1 MAG: hypothetical protein COZ57_35750 [Armatimonadetes bacterium CG_4_8_14_3_um_filter_66_20]PIY41917.1 MAG: hypothetical protein COZ06_26110 [Armatimonadetes bacterium CG_4_10_14_3_um_filter_66_18]PIZ51402.1 MAG: hypothetical protein C